MRSPVRSRTSCESAVRRSSAKLSALFAALTVPTSLNGEADGAAWAGFATAGTDVAAIAVVWATGGVATEATGSTGTVETASSADGQHHHAATAATASHAASHQGERAGWVTTMCKAA